MIRLARPIFVLAALGLALIAGTARAQESPAADCPTQEIPDPSAPVLSNWNDIGGRLITMAEDWPEEKYSYRMKPEMRTFQQVILHIAGSNYDMLNRMTKSKVGDGRNDPPMSEYKTKAETLAILKKSIADGATEIANEGPSLIQFLNYWIGYTEHMGEHYGLLVAYYRENGVVPPESRPKK